MPEEHTLVPPHERAADKRPPQTDIPHGLETKQLEVSQFRDEMTRLLDRTPDERKGTSLTLAEEPEARKPCIEIYIDDSIRDEVITMIQGEKDNIKRATEVYTRLQEHVIDKDTPPAMEADQGVTEHVVNAMIHRYNEWNETPHYIVGEKQNDRFLI